MVRSTRLSSGPLSTLVATPPQNSKNDFGLPARAPALSIKPFESQFSQVESLLAAKPRSAQPYPTCWAFDAQFTEIENLLDAEKKRALDHNPGTRERAPADDDDDSNSWIRQWSFSSQPRRSSYTVPSRSSRRSNSSTSSSPSRWYSWHYTDASSEDCSEDGRPHQREMDRWVEHTMPEEFPAARMSSRGVECRLNVGGRVCEWVIFL